MDGLKFFWIAWFFWIFITFFMKRSHPKRVIYGILLMITIITSSITMSILGFQIQLIGIYGLLISSFFVTKYRLREQLYLFITSLIICLAYVSFQIYELFDPVWLFLSREWMLAGILTYLVILLQSNATKRVLTLIIGTCYGEIVYALVLKPFNFPYTICSFGYLDSISLSFLFICIWYSLEQSASIFDQLMNHVGKERHG